MFLFFTVQQDPLPFLLYLRLRRYIAMVLCVCLCVIVSALAQIYCYDVVCLSVGQLFW